MGGEPTAKRKAQKGNVMTTTTTTTAEMTMRKYHEAVLALPNLPADVEAKAKSELAKLDAANAKRQSKPSKTAVANEPIKASIVELIKAQGAMVASAIATALTTPEAEVTTSKVSALCRQLVDDGVLTATEVKVKNKGKVKQYALADDGDTNGTVQATDYELNTMN